MERPAEPTAVGLATGAEQLRWPRVMQEYNPEAWPALDGWLRASQVTSEIDRRTAELIIVVLDAHVAWPAPFIDLHIHRAIDAGCTVRQLVEALTVAGMTMGPHLLNHGLTAVDRVVSERRELGLPVPATLADVTPAETG